MNRTGSSAGVFATEEPEPETSTPCLVVFGAGALLFVCFGSAYAIPVFFPAIHRALMMPSPHLTAVFSATGAVYFSLGMVSGPLADRVGIRRVSAAGCLLLALGLFVASRAVSELAFDIGCVLGVGGGIGLCFVPTVGGVQKLCRKNAALAGGVAASGIGVGTFVLPPVAQVMINHVGWRETLQLLGALTACGSFAALPFATPTAELNGIRPALSTESARECRSLLRSHPFRLLYAAQLALSVVAFVPFSHLQLFAEQMGWSGSTGGYLIGFIGIGSLFGRLIIGIAAEAFGSSRTAALCALLMSASMALLLLATNCWELDADAALYGAGYGGVIGLTGPIVAEVAGVRGICGSVGIIATSRAFGILVGPWMVSIAACRFGGYEVPFLCCSVLALLGAVLLGELHRRVALRCIG